MSVPSLCSGELDEESLEACFFLSFPSMSTSSELAEVGDLCVRSSGAEPVSWFPHSTLRLIDEDDDEVCSPFVTLVTDFFPGPALSP